MATMAHGAIRMMGTRRSNIVMNEHGCTPLSIV